MCRARSIGITGDTDWVTLFSDPHILHLLFINGNQTLANVFCKCSDFDATHGLPWLFPKPSFASCSCRFPCCTLGGCHPPVWLTDWCSPLPVRLCCHTQQYVVVKLICSDQLPRSWLLTGQNSPWLSHSNKDFFHPQPLFPLMFFHSFCLWSLLGSFLCPADHNAFRLAMGN